jgi:hypothetical protein
MTEHQQQSGSSANGTGGRPPPSKLSNSTGNKDSGESGNSNKAKKYPKIAPELFPVDS